MHLFFYFIAGALAVVVIASDLILGPSANNKVSYFGISQLAYSYISVISLISLLFFTGYVLRVAKSGQFNWIGSSLALSSFIIYFPCSLIVSYNTKNSIPANGIMNPGTSYAYFTDKTYIVHGQVGFCLFVFTAMAISIIVSYRTSKILAKRLPRNA